MHADDRWQRRRVIGLQMIPNDRLGSAKRRWDVPGERTNLGQSWPKLELDGDGGDDLLGELVHNFGKGDDGVVGNCQAVGAKIVRNVRGAVV